MRGCHVTKSLRPDLHYEIPIPPPMRSCAVIPRPSTSCALLRRRMSARGYECLCRKLFVYTSRSYVNDCGSFIPQSCASLTICTHRTKEYPRKCYQNKTILHSKHPWIIQRRFLVPIARKHQLLYKLLFSQTIFMESVNAMSMMQTAL